MPVVTNDTGMEEDPTLELNADLEIPDMSNAAPATDDTDLPNFDSEPELVPVGAIISDNDEIRFCNPFLDAASTQPPTEPETFEKVNKFEFKDSNNAEARLKELRLLSLGKKLLDMCKGGQSLEVKQLMIDGAPFIADWVGTSPLHYSVLNKHVEVTELLLKAGICRDAKNKVDRTPLHAAAHMGCSYMVKLLLTYGADVNCRDMLSMTPLHWVAESGDLLTAKILLDYGADTTARNKFGKSPYALAMRGRHTDVAKAIQDAENMDFDTRMFKVAHLRQKIVGQTRAMKPVAEILEPSAVSTEGAIKLLKSHGVTMIEPDKDTVISSALLNGHTIRLTDAGKLAFKSLDRNPVSLISENGNSTKSDPEDPVTVCKTKRVTDDEPPPAKIPRLLSNGQVLHKVSAQQLIEMKKENKIVIKGVTPRPCVLNLPPTSNVPTSSPTTPTSAITLEKVPEELVERNLIYLQRLETRARECKRQADALQKQYKIKEEEYKWMAKQIEMFKMCLPPK